MTWGRALRHVGAVAVLLQVAWLAYVFSHPAHMGADAVQVWFQSERIRSGEPLYRPMGTFGPDVMTGTSMYPLAEHSPYLPPAASVVALLPRVEMVTFARVAHVVVLGLFWLYAAILARLFLGRWSLGGALAAQVVLLIWPGALLMLSESNVDPLLWCLFGAAFLAPAARGGLLTAMAAIKVYAVWPLAFLVARKDRRVLGSAVVVALAAAVVTLLALEAGGTVRAVADWVRYVPAAAAQGTFSAWNVSLSFLPLRVARWLGWEYQGGALPPPAREWLLVASVAAPLAAGWFTRRASAELQLAIVMGATLLASPLCWMGYLTALFAPVAAWLRPPGPALDREGRSGAAVATDHG